MGNDARDAASSGPRAPRHRDDALWSRYARTRTPRDRAALVEAHLPIVHRAAAELARRLPRHVEHEFLVQAGVLGLFDAVDRFAPAHGVRFETFATPRVRGAIVDALRQIDWAPRSVRRRAAEADSTRALLQGRLHRTPTDQELGAEMGVAPGALATLEAELDRARPVPLDDRLMDSGARSERTQDARGPEDPQDATEALALRSALGDALEALKERERAVLQLYYFEDRTLKEICEQLGITESGVSRARVRALRAVGGWLADRGWADPA